MRWYFPLLLFLVLLQSCNEQVPVKEAYKVTADTTDLAEIIKRGQLIALTDFSSTSYFIYRGSPMGFDYELLQRFADHLGVELSIKIVDDMDSVIHLLNKNEGDIIAANFTITRERAKEVVFSAPMLQTRQVLVQRMPEGWARMRKDKLEKLLVRNPLDLMGREIHVRKESSFYPRLVNLMEEIGGPIDIVEAGNVGTEDLIEKVSLGDIDFTVADENIALLSKGYFPNIDIKTALSFNQRVAWAMRKSSVTLQDTLDSWLEEFVDTKTYAILYLKYFKARSQHQERVQSEYSSLRGDKLSPYDAMIKRESKRLGWDWKLLTAMIFQESRFIADAEAWTGASGLMQLVPETAERFGADSLSDPQQNIHAGVSFLITLQDYWSDKDIDSLEQFKFVLASYNVGLGHVLDAVRLTNKYEGNPLIWDEVAVFLEKKSTPEYYKDEVVKHGYCRGSEPVNYVRMVLAHYEHYRNTTL